MLSLDHLRTFIAVAEAGSQAAGAQALGVPRSTVSRHLQRLESALGERLFTAEPGGPLRLTPAGRRIYTSASRPISDLSLLQRRRPSPPRGASRRLHLLAPPTFTQKLAGRLAAAFIEATGDLDMELRSAPRGFDLAASQADVGFMVGLEPPANTRHFALGTLQARLYAAPGLISVANAPAAPGDLAAHQFASTECDGGERQSWTLWRHGATDLEYVVVRCPFRSDQIDTVLDLTCAGLAIGRLPSFVGDPLVAEGALVPVLPGWSVTLHSLTVALRPGVRNPAADQFIRFVADRFDAILNPPAGTDRNPNPAA